MTRLLCIQASPRRERSASRAAANAFLESFREAQPNATVDCLNLFDEEIPEFNEDAANAKYRIMHGEKMEPGDIDAWRPVEALIERFKAADKYLIALPMWNFGIPYKLKQYIDCLLQPGYTFSFDPKAGYSGLVTGRPACVVYARGGAYSPGTEGAAYDMQRPYMELALQFIGFTDIRAVVIEPTLQGGPKERDRVVAAAREEAKAIAKDF